MNNERVLHLALEAGRVLLTSGAETNRVEDTIRRILKSYNLSEIEPLVTPTGIFCSVVDEEGKITSMTKRIKGGTINLEKISLVNEVSRNLVSGMITFEIAAEKIKEIDKKPPYKNRYRVVCAGISCAAFAYIFGGGYLDSISAGIAGTVLYVFLVIAGKFNITSFLVNISGGFLATFIVILLSLAGLSYYMDAAIIGSIMPLVPGIGFSNAIRDIFAGDYLSGNSRIIDATLVATCVATGVGLALLLIF